MKKLNGVKDLITYQKSYSLAMDIFKISKTFPREETYSLKSQIRKSSRSVSANLSEGFSKRNYTKHFLSKLVICDGECSETLTWLDFARDCEYINEKIHDELYSRCIEVGKMLGSMIESPEKFKTK